MVRPATVRFYFDADVLGLAKAVAALRPDCTFPGDPGATLKGITRPACPVASPKVKDPVWIPMVAERGWIIVTRDSHISTRPAEIAAVNRHDARLIALSGNDAIGTWNQLEVLMAHWRRIEALTDTPGPWMYVATRTSFRQLLI